MGSVTDKLWRNAVLKKVPLTGAFELLPMCNLQCKMCYVRKSKQEVDALGGLLETERWIELGKQARDAGMLYPLLTGGEPFLHKDFQKIFAEFLSLGLQVSINSNATLIDEPMAKWLGEHRPTRINITVYGGSEDSYQRLCGDGDAYARMRRAVEWLNKYHVPVKFNTSITPQNYDDLEAIMAFAKKMGKPIQTATYMFPPVRRDAHLIGQNERLSPRQAGLARVKADYLQGNQKWFLGQAARFQHFVPLHEIAFEEKSEADSQKMNCRAGRCSFWLDWQGNIGNCGMHSTIKIPMKDLTLEAGWKKVVEETEKVRYSSTCAGCPNVRLCHACIAMIYNECGDYHGRPEYLCKMNEAAAEYYKMYAEKITSELGQYEIEKAEGIAECDFEY